MVPKARFTELLEDIEPSPTTKSDASTAHCGLREYLRGHATYRARRQHDFLAGSYTRDTAIRPRTVDGSIERPDVDIIVVTNHTTQDAPEAVLKELADALDPEFAVERINKRSVRVVGWSAEMDVVPVIASGLAYRIPDRDTEGWLDTNPPMHTTWATAQNTEFDGRFKPLVKLLKWWRRVKLSHIKRPKGFSFEVLVAKHAPRSETHLGEAFAQLLESIYAHYSALMSMGLKPFLADPAFSGNDVLLKVTVPQWREFLEKVRVHAGYARRAQQQDDMEEATRLWRKVFGDRFPATKSLAKAISFTTSVTAPTSGFIFPDAPAAPSKPRGFA